MDSKQREMPLMGAVKDMERVPMALVRRCHSRLDALRLTVAYSGLKHAYIAESIGMRPAQFSKIMSGQAHLSENKRDALMDACGNEAMEQYGAWVRGYRLERDDKEKELRALRDRVAAMEEEVAAEAAA